MENDSEEDTWPLNSSQYSKRSLHKINEYLFLFYHKLKK